MEKAEKIVLNMNIENLKKGIVERLLKVEKPLKVILFGSYAEGNPLMSVDKKDWLRMNKVKG